jgi:hypothetical protein
MTVARDRSAWGRKVEYKLLPTPSSGLIHESPKILNETRMTFDKLALPKFGRTKLQYSTVLYCTVLY